MSQRDRLMLQFAGLGLRSHGGLDAHKCTGLVYKNAGYTNRPEHAFVNAASTACYYVSRETES